ncbi:MBL fold metallo-hydrolase [Sodalis sp. RH20]|uniref:MBL fold metallo-hydrolase n=1 Tax=unclassified Sodalis (in: enterobacteria) TaxID=2636512 RepID=UPI0039B42133
MMKRVNKVKVAAVFMLATALSPALALVPAAATPVAQQKHQAPGFYRMMLGKFEITAVSDGTVTIPLDKLLLDITPAMLKQRLADEDMSANVETSINAYVINTGSNLILVDTGSGPLFGNNGGRLLENLRAAGYPAEKIDTVLLTHIHADHSGGLVHNGQYAFPNATVWVNQRDVDFWLNPRNIGQVRESEKHTFAESAASFRPVIAAGKLKTFTGQTQLFPGINAIPAPGHTPGHTLYMIESAGQKLLIWGDTIHSSAVQFPDPDTTITYDWDKTQAAESRKAILEEAVKNDYLIAADHIAFPGLGHVKYRDRTGDRRGYRWVPVNYSLAGLE